MEVCKIVFRGKRIGDGEWVYGDLSHEPYGTVISYEDEIKDKGNCAKTGCKKYIVVMVYPETVCRYTGLTDKNGRKIFEGDMCTFFDKVYNANLFGVVKFGEYEQDGSGGEYPPVSVIGFYVEIIEFAYKEDGIYDDEDYPQWRRTISILQAMDERTYEKFEIIGNIFDNPELLKQ